MMKRLALLVLAVCAGSGEQLIMGRGAFGHDFHRPDLDQWFGSLENGKGAACCGGPKIDATVLVDADWESKDGHYRVRIDGEWVDVPDDAVVNRPNLYGRALVWPTRGWGALTIRCFMPGPMT